jgi:hypothetical protein
LKFAYYVRLAHSQAVSDSIMGLAVAASSRNSLFFRNFDPEFARLIAPAK